MQGPHSETCGCIRSTARDVGRKDAGEWWGDTACSLLRLGVGDCGRADASALVNPTNYYWLLILITAYICMVLKLSLGRLLGFLAASRTGTGTGTLVDCSIFLNFNFAFCLRACSSLHYLSSGFSRTLTLKASFLTISSLLYQFYSSRLAFTHESWLKSSNIWYFAYKDNVSAFPGPITSRSHYWAYISKDSEIYLECGFSWSHWVDHWTNRPMSIVLRIPACLSYV